MPDTSPRIDFGMDGGHPFDILAAPSVESGVRLGYEMASRYRALLAAALDVARDRAAEVVRLRERNTALVAECRRLREVRR